LATRFNDRRTAAAAETNKNIPVSVGTGSESFSRLDSLSPAIESTPGPVVGRVIDLSSLTTSQGFVIQGDSAYDLAGWSVSSAGDVNGDGIDDVIVGAPTGIPGFRTGEAGASAVGEAYVIYGQLGTRGLLDLSTLSSSQGFVIRGGGS